jgi:hypothetical protein
MILLVHPLTDSSPFPLCHIHLEMSSPNRHNSENPRRERLEEWTWLEPYGNVSPNRPPVFNDANRSCAEAAQQSNGTAQQLPQPIFEEQPRFNYENTRRLWNHLQSCSSSAVSSYGPEGIEKPEPDLHVVSFYLPLAPPPGLGEERHRRTTSFESNMSYSMRQYLATPDNQDIMQVAEPVNSGNHFLEQTTFVQPSTKHVNKSSKRSKPSHVTDSSGDASIMSWGIDPVTGNGAWMDEDGNVYPADYYPSTLSEYTESG